MDGNAPHPTPELMLTQIQDWVKQGLIPADKVSSITKESPEFVITAVYDALHVSVKDALDAKEKEVSIANQRSEFRNEIDNATKTRWEELKQKAQDEADFKLKTRTKIMNVAGVKENPNYDPDCQLDGDNAKWFVEKGGKPINALIVKGIPKAIVEIALHDYYEQRNKDVERLMTPVVKKSKKKGSSKKEMKDKNAKEITHPDFTEDKAKALYETQKGYAFKVDVDEKSVYAEKKKVMKGKKNPIDGTILEDTIYIVKWRPIIRSTSFADADDPNRCKAVSTFKPIRYNSKYARDNKFIGDAQVMCASKCVDGTLMCAGCSKSGKTLFSDYVYKKIDKKASEFMTDVIEINQ